MSPTPRPADDEPEPAPIPAGPRAPAGRSFTGTVVARCKVGERLGRGVTSHVFRARYEPLGKEVALKILTREMAGVEEMRRRFLAEARAIAKLDHENIVKVIDVVEDRGMLCILMELVPGQTLQDRLNDEGVIPPVQASRIAAEVARALEGAHSARIVHRDVKPANVMLSGAPGDETVKVVDFGLAVQQEMNRVGTPLYMSPEAAQGKRIDEKSDVYALGVCLYQMLTGTHPFKGSTVKEILAAHVNQEFVPPSQVRPQVGTAFDDVLRKLLVKSKGYRPSAGEAAEMLEAIADDLEVRILGAARRRKRAVRKAAPEKQAKASATLWAFVAVGAVVLIVLVASLGGGRDEPPPPPPPEQPQEPQVDPAQAAFDEVDRWFVANPPNPAEAVRRWGEIERRFPGTTWATRAGEQRKLAEDVLAKKREEDEAARRRAEEAAAKARAAELARRPEAQRARLAEAIAALDFAAAQAVLDEMEPPSDVDDSEWRRRCNRIDHLATNFVRRMDQGLRDARPPVKARAFFADAKDVEVVVGATNAGAVVSDGKEQRTRSWAKVPPDKLLKAAQDKVLSTVDWENDLLMAVIAEVYGLKNARGKPLWRDYADLARSAAPELEAVETKVRTLFGE